MNKSPSSSFSPFDNKQIFIFQKKKKKKEIFKKGLRTRGIELVLLRLLSKKKKFQKFQFLRKIQVF